MLRLPLDQRAVLLLVSLEEMSYADVARITAVPIGTVNHACRAPAAACRSCWKNRPALPRQRLQPARRPVQSPRFGV